MPHLHTEKEIEKHLHDIANLDEGADITVCIGQRSEPHPPILIYGWSCPYCDSIGDYEFSLKELNKELEEAKASVEVLEEDKAQLEVDFAEEQKSHNEIYEKLMEVYRVYPECGI